MGGGGIEKGELKQGKLERVKGTQVLVLTSHLVPPVAAAAIAAMEKLFILWRTANNKTCLTETPPPGPDLRGGRGGS